MPEGKEEITMCITCGRNQPMRGFLACVTCYIEASEQQLQEYKDRIKEKKIAAQLAQMAARENEQIRLEHIIGQ